MFDSYFMNSDFNKQLTKNRVEFWKMEKDMHLRTLRLMTELNLPIIQINGQRKLGPPGGWIGPAPPLDCEVFVARVPRTVIEADLYPVFRKIGEIYEIRLMIDFSGMARGYCFVMYANAADARRATKELNQYEIVPGTKIGVVPSVNNCRLYIGYLSTQVKPSTIIQRTFKMTKTVEKVSVFRHSEGRAVFALLYFKTHRDAAIARRKLLPVLLAASFGKYITIEWAYPCFLPSNVHEETGIREEDGTIKINKKFIPRQERKIVKTNNFPGQNMTAKDRSHKCTNNPKTSNQVLLPNSLRISENPTLPYPRAFQVCHSEMLARSRKAFLELTNCQTVTHTRTTTKITNSKVTNLSNPNDPKRMKENEFQKQNRDNYYHQKSVNAKMSPLSYISSNAHPKVFDSRKTLTYNNSLKNDDSNIARNDSHSIRRKVQAPIDPIGKPNSTSTSNISSRPYRSNSFSDHNMRNLVIHPTLWNSLENCRQDPPQVLDLNKNYVSEVSSFNQAHPLQTRPNDPTIFMQNGSDNSLILFENIYPMVWKHTSHYDTSGATLSNYSLTPLANGNESQAMAFPIACPNHCELQESRNREYLQQMQDHKLTPTIAGMAEPFNQIDSFCQSIHYNCLDESSAEDNNNHYQQEVIDQSKRNSILYPLLEVPGSPTDIMDFASFNRLPCGNSTVQCGATITPKREDYQISLSNSVMNDYILHNQQHFAPNFHGGTSTPFPPHNQLVRYQTGNQAINESCGIIERPRI